MDEDLEKDIGSRAETSSQQSNHSNTSFQPLSEKSEKSRKWSTSNLIKQIIKLIIDQWFLISLGLVILVASQVQVPASHQKLKSTLVSYICVSIIFFLTGCTLETQTLLDNYSRWKIHLFVQLQCYLLTSATIFALVSACATNPEFMDAGLLLGLLLTGCTATTISSNVIMTGEAHGNQALTVVQSTLGNFLAPFLTPLIFSMYTSTGAWYTEVLPKEKGGYGEIYRRVFKQLGLSLFVPMLAGQLVQNFFPKLNQRVVIGWNLKKISPFALLILVWQTYDQAFGTGAFKTVKGDNMIFIVFISIALFIIFNVVAFFSSILWLPKEDTISVCYCVPAKTPALGVPLSMTMFVGLNSVLEAKLQIPMVIYQGLQIVGGTLLIQPLRNWIDRDHQSSIVKDRVAQHSV